MKLSEIHNGEGEIHQLAGYAMVKGYDSLAMKITLDSIEYNGVNNEFLGVTVEEHKQLVEIEYTFCQKFIESFG